MIRTRGDNSNLEQVLPVRVWSDPSKNRIQSSTTSLARARVGQSDRVPGLIAPLTVLPVRVRNDPHSSDDHHLRGGLACAREE